MKIRKMTFAKGLFFTLILLLAACANTPKSHQIMNESKDISREIESYHFETFQFDTAHLGVEKSKKEVTQWSDLDDFFPIYQLSSKCLGIAIELGDGGHYELTDKLVDKNTGETDAEIDTLGTYTLQKSLNLERAIFNNDTTRFFTIYCTKGKTMSQIKRVLYHSGECSAILVLELMPIDKDKYGEPLIASKQVIDFTYTTVNSFQKDLLVYAKYWQTKTDYSDNTPPVQFAYNDTYFLVFYDNFKWYERDDKDCLFPTREIFKKEGNNVKKVWTQGLDLFGIPCD
jgi:hypothetical protein